MIDDTTEPETQADTDRNEEPHDDQTHRDRDSHDKVSPGIGRQAGSADAPPQQTDTPSVKDSDSQHDDHCRQHNIDIVEDTVTAVWHMGHG